MKIEELGYAASRRRATPRRHPLMKIEELGYAASRRVPRGIRNHNPGNIERRPGIRWQGAAADQSADPRFVVFESPKWGIRAIARVLITYQDARQARDGSRIDTVREIIARWAPATENPTDLYTSRVADLMGIGADDTLDVYDFKTLYDLINAIITYENGANPYPRATLEAGIRLAGIEPTTKSLLRAGDVAATVTAGAAATTGIIADAVQSSLPQAASAAQALQPAAPRWVIPTLLGLVIAAAIVALFKQVRDKRAGAR